jgi:hypothetical protein
MSVENAAGTVGGIINFLGNLAGFVADRVGFATNFLITGAILLAGLACFLLMLGKIEQFEVPPVEISGITEIKHPSSRRLMGRVSASIEGNRCRTQ